MEAATTAANTSIILATVSDAFCKSYLSIPDNNFKFKDINIKAVDIANIPIPALAAYFPAKLLAIIIVANDPNITIRDSILDLILFVSIESILSNASTNIFKATTVANIDAEAPNLTFRQSNAIVASPSIAPDIIFIERSKLLNSIESKSFNAPTIIFKAADIANKVIDPFDN